MSIHPHKQRSAIALAFVLTILVIVAVFIFPKVVSSPEEGVPTEVANATSQSFEGVWSTHGESPDLTAIIQDDVITVTLVGVVSGNMPYWRGTFKNSDKSQNVVTSVRLEDKITMAQGATKKFTIEGTKITFDITMLGQTKTARLIRD